MPDNPLTDAFLFFTGATNDYLTLGPWRFLLVALYWALLLGSIYLAIRNWREDPAQRTGTHLGTAIVRIMIGTMWFEGMLWKLPLPLSGGLEYWTQQEATRAAFEFHREFVTSFLLPNLRLFGPLVFLTELMFSVSLILGFAVRFVGVIGIFFVLQLWLGIYRAGDPAEWPWSYLFLAILMFLFSLYAAGRSLGLDAWLRRSVPAVREGQGFIGGILNRAT
ncbi:MAG: DoxX family membrane protein [Rhodoplanes sp.]